MVSLRRDGDMTTLEVDAITNSSDETLTESNSISERIIAVAGNQLKEELSTTVKGKQGERQRERGKDLTNARVAFALLQSAALGMCVSRVDTICQPSMFCTLLHPPTRRSSRQLPRMPCTVATGEHD